VDLREADLRGADLRGADLMGAKLPIYCKWSLYHTGNTIHIGCESRTIEYWDKFFAEDCQEELETPRDSEDFKRIKACYIAHKAYVEGL
jgi:hypothetical protein